MAELATIARPYAEAIFKVAADQNQFGVWDEVLTNLALASQTEELKQLANDPKVLKEQLVELLMTLAKSEKISSDLVQRFLSELVEYGRLSVLSEVAQQYRVLRDATNDVTQVLIHSAYPISDTELQALLPTLEKRFGKKLKPQVEIDESLIGGICAVVGDDTLDLSVKARLEQMKVALMA